jgi:hypothetical protein
MKFSDESGEDKEIDKLWKTLPLVRILGEHQEHMLKICLDKFPYVVAACLVMAWAYDNCLKPEKDFPISNLPPPPDPIIDEANEWLRPGLYSDDDADEPENPESENGSGELLGEDARWGDVFGELEARRGGLRVEEGSLDLEEGEVEQPSRMARFATPLTPDDIDRKSSVVNGCEYESQNEWPDDWQNLEPDDRCFAKYI